MKQKLILLVFYCLTCVMSDEMKMNVMNDENAPSKFDILYGPLNDAVIVGNPARLNCEGTDGCRIGWFEYATGNTMGSAISDGEYILPGHPNSTRYHIIHDSPNSYDLLINITVLEDGAMYRCTDLNVYDSAYAELVMLKQDPVCTSNIPTNGVLVEGRNYSINCSVEYKGIAAPTMTWTGPMPYSVESFTSDTSVWSMLVFRATTMNTDQQYVCVTNFTDGFDQSDADHASNIPEYQHTYQSVPINFEYYGGVSYIRWGRTVCEGTAEIVYKDKAPEVVAGWGSAQVAAEWYSVEARCQYLPCPMENDGWEIACTVCTK